MRNAGCIQKNVLRRDGVVRDYEHFYCPLIVSAEKVKAKIRNLTYRYMTGDSIFPKETLQYDPYIIREALNNAIAHQDYSKAGRITVQEHEDDYLIFCNCGDFIPGSIKNVLKAEYSASNYRNPFLATAMVNLNMIDTVGSGILKMFLAQKKRCFPLPDYDFSNHEVRMKLYGKILDINYTRRLLNEDLPLSEVFELDRKQKEEFNSHRNDLVKEQVKEQANVQENVQEKTREEMILNLLQNNNTISIRELAEQLNMTAKTIQRDLDKLKSQNLIRRIGPDKGGQWEVIKQ